VPRVIDDRLVESTEPDTHCDTIALPEVFQPEPIRPIVVAFTKRSVVLAYPTLVTPEVVAVAGKSYHVDAPDS
jgi:hypothetical protein